MDRQSLLLAIHAGRERLRAALVELDDAAMLERIDDEWTRKDVIAHLEAWERRVVELYRRLSAGESPDDGPETDEINARFYAASRERSLDDVRHGEDAAWRAVLDLVETASDADLFDGERFAWTRGDPFADWIHANTDEHFDEHIEQLTRRPRPPLVRYPVRARVAVTGR